MTNEEEALRMALEALDGGAFGKELERVVLALRAALEEQPAEQQEPMAWRYNGKLHEFDPSDWATSPVTPLYTSPQVKPWVGLTDEEIDALAMDDDGLPNSHLEFAWAIEAKLKEKNQ